MEGAARFTTHADVAELVRLRAVMFESMGVDASARGWRTRAEVHLEEGLAGGHIVGAVVDAPEPGGLAASCLAELAWRIPSPTRPAAPQAYVSSVSTDPRWRRRGFARAALALLLAELGDRGVRRVELHATPDGTALYESLGFVPRTGGKSYLLELDGV